MRLSWRTGSNGAKARLRRKKLRVDGEPRSTENRQLWLGLDQYLACSCGVDSFLTCIASLHIGMRFKHVWNSMNDQWESSSGNGWMMHAWLDGVIRGCATDTKSGPLNLTLLHRAECQTDSWIWIRIWPPRLWTSSRLDMYCSAMLTSIVIPRQKKSEEFQDKRSFHSSLLLLCASARDSPPNYLSWNVFWTSHEYYAWIAGLSIIKLFLLKPQSKPIYLTICFTFEARFQSLSMCSSADQTDQLETLQNKTGLSPNCFWTPSCN